MKRSEAWTRALCLTVAVGLMSMVAAASAVAQEVPYDGVVVEDKVQVRAGMGRVHYVVGELPRDTVVRVDEIFLGWHKIVPPEGVTSYISKAFVDARGDGGSGRVNTNRTKVMAASVNGPGESYRVQVTLNEGDTVQILGEEGSYYRIAPPANTYVFLPPGSVRRMEGLEAVAEQPQPQPQVEPAAPPVAEQSGDPVRTEPLPDAVVENATERANEETAVAVEPDAAEANGEGASDVETAVAADANGEGDAGAVVGPDVERGNVGELSGTTTLEPQLTEDASTTADADATTTAAAESAATTTATATAARVNTPAVSPALREVEQVNLPLFELPLREQPIEQMIAAYEAVQGGAELPGIDQRIIRQRLSALEHNLRIVAAIRSLDEARTASAQAEQAARAAAEAASDAGAGLPVRYDAVGRLLASSVFDGQSLPRMYRLVDPGSGRTVAYVEPGGPIDDFRMLGKVVGIVGERSYDASIKREVIQIDRINLLAAAETE